MNSGDDERDFEAFVRRWSSSLFVTAAGLTGRRDLAEELVQDTLAALYPKWAAVRAADSQIAYVRRSLTNRFISQARRQVAGSGRWEVTDQEMTPDPASGVTDRHWIAWLLADLPPRQRAAILLRYQHDLDDRQIAEHIGCRPVTVRSLISRGLRAVQVKVGAADLHPTPSSGSRRP